MTSKVSGQQEAIKFWGVKSYRRFPTAWRVASLIPTLFKGQVHIHSFIHMSRRPIEGLIVLVLQIG